MNLGKRKMPGHSLPHPPPLFQAGRGPQEEEWTLGDRRLPRGLWDAVPLSAALLEKVPPSLSFVVEEPVQTVLREEYFVFPTGNQEMIPFLPSSVYCLGISLSPRSVSQWLRRSLPCSSPQFKLLRQFHIFMKSAHTCATQ